MDILKTISTRETPQTKPADERQVRNDAEGYSFTITPEARFRRFLVLGADGGTYYASAQKIAQSNADAVLALARTDHALARDVLLEVSLSGRAPKQNATLFSLAILSSVGEATERRAALDMLPLVARTGTHLFQFATYVNQFRGWGRTLHRAVGNWYLDKLPDEVAFQAVKYRQRDGWTHRDLLRKAKPTATNPAMRDAFKWIASGAQGENTPRIIEGFILAQENPAHAARLVREYTLPWETLPDEALNRADTWEALLDNGLPQTALMRQLPRLTRLGLLPQMGGRTAEVAARLSDRERLVNARVHPMNVLVAQRTYADGYSARGSSHWEPTRQIVDALDAGFYAAFGAVKPAGKRTMLALDISASMTWHQIGGLSLTPREASAAMALVTMATESECLVTAFTTGLRALSISPRQRLDDVIRSISNLPHGGTDCSLPMLAAIENRLLVDTFVVYTDNQTWAGRTHPHQALRAYREKSGVDARLVVVGMEATDFSIADPSDPGMLDVAGFDSAVPNLISDFSRGE